MQKTHLIVMGTKATAKRREEVTLQADQHVIAPTRTEKLLGGHISEDLKWKEHILGSDQSLSNQLTSRVNGLLMVAARAPFSGWLWPMAGWLWPMASSYPSSAT